MCSFFAERNPERAKPHFKLIYVEKPFYMWAAGKVLRRTITFRRHRNVCVTTDGPNGILSNKRHPNRSTVKIYRNVLSRSVGGIFITSASAPRLTAQQKSWSVLLSAEKAMKIN